MTRVTIVDKHTEAYDKVRCLVRQIPPIDYDLRKYINIYVPDDVLELYKEYFIKVGVYPTPGCKNDTSDGFPIVPYGTSDMNYWLKLIELKSCTSQK